MPYAFLCLSQSQAAFDRLATSPALKHFLQFHVFDAKSWFGNDYVSI